MASDNQVTKSTSIADVINVCPNAVEIFNRYGMGCFACMAAAAETVEEGALMHGIDVNDILKDLNAACKQSS
jgi:hybrid cluster-associated redox disulfide protein